MEQENVTDAANHHCPTYLSWLGTITRIGRTDVLQVARENFRVPRRARTHVFIGRACVLPASEPSIVASHSPIATPLVLHVVCGAPVTPRTYGDSRGGGRRASLSARLVRPFVGPRVREETVAHTRSRASVAS